MKQCKKNTNHLLPRAIPANISLGEDVLKTYWKHLQRKIFLSFKTSSRRLQHMFARHLWRRLEDVLKTPLPKTSWGGLEVALQARFEDVLKNKTYLLRYSLYVSAITILKNVLAFRDCWNIFDQNTGTFNFPDFRLRFFINLN